MQSSNYNINSIHLSPDARKITIRMAGNSRGNGHKIFVGGGGKSQQDSIKSLKGKGINVTKFTYKSESETIEILCQKSRVSLREIEIEIRQHLLKKIADFNSKQNVGHFRRNYVNNVQNSRSHESRVQRSRYQNGPADQDAYEYRLPFKKEVPKEIKEFLEYLNNENKVYPKRNTSLCRYEHRCTKEDCKYAHSLQELRSTFDEYIVFTGGSKDFMQKVYNCLKWLLMQPETKDKFLKLNPNSSWTVKCEPSEFSEMIGVWYELTKIDTFFPFENFNDIINILYARTRSYYDDKRFDGGVFNKWKISLGYLMGTHKKVTKEDQELRRKKISELKKKIDRMDDGEEKDRVKDEIDKLVCLNDLQRYDPIVDESVVKQPYAIFGEDDFVSLPEKEFHKKKQADNYSFDRYGYVFAKDQKDYIKNRVLKKPRDRREMDQKVGNLWERMINSVVNHFVFRVECDYARISKYIEGATKPVQSREKYWIRSFCNVDGLDSKIISEGNRNLGKLLGNLIIVFFKSEPELFRSIFKGNNCVMHASKNYWEDNKKESIYHCQGTKGGLMRTWKTTHSKGSEVNLNVDSFVDDERYTQEYLVGIRKYRNWLMKLFDIKRVNDPVEFGSTWYFENREIIIGTQIFENYIENAEENSTFFNWIEKKEKEKDILGKLIDWKTNLDFDIEERKSIGEKQAGIILWAEESLGYEMSTIAELELAIFYYNRRVWLEKSEFAVNNIRDFFEKYTGEFLEEIEKKYDFRDFEKNKYSMERFIDKKLSFRKFVRLNYEKFNQKNDDFDIVFHFLVVDDPTGRTSERYWKIYVENKYYYIVVEEFSDELIEKIENEPKLDEVKLQAKPGSKRWKKIVRDTKKASASDSDSDSDIDSNSDSDSDFDDDSDSDSDSDSDDDSIRIEDYDDSGTDDGNSVSSFPLMHRTFNAEEELDNDDSERQNYRKIHVGFNFKYKHMRRMEDASGFVIENLDMSQVNKILQSKHLQIYSTTTLGNDSDLESDKNDKSVVFKIRRVKFETCSNFISNLAKFAFSENMCVSEFELDFCKTEFKSDLIRYNRNNKASSVNSMSTVSTLKTATTKSVPTVDQVKENKEERQKLKAMKKKEKLRERQMAKLSKSRPKDLKVDNSKSAEDSDTKLTQKKEKKPELYQKKSVKRGGGSSNMTKRY